MVFPTYGKVFKGSFSAVAAPSRLFFGGLALRRLRHR